MSLAPSTFASGPSWHTHAGIRPSQQNVDEPCVYSHTHPNISSHVCMAHCIGVNEIRRSGCSSFLVYAAEP